MKTLSKTQQPKNQRTKSKHKPVQSKGKASGPKAIELEGAEQLSVYDSYYKQLSEEVETIERHVRELRQTPGLEHLTEAEAHAQIDFMLRFSAWVFNQHLQEPHIGIVAEEDDLVLESIKVSKVQKSSRQSNKKVTKSLSR